MADRVYRIKDGFVVRKIGKQIMAVPVGTRTNEIHGMIALTESGNLLWQTLIGGADKNSLVALLTGAYNVETERAAADVDEFLAGLEKQGVLDGE